MDEQDILRRETVIKLLKNKIKALEKANFDYLKSNSIHIRELKDLEFKYKNQIYILESELKMLRVELDTKNKLSQYKENDMNFTQEISNTVRDNLPSKRALETVNSVKNLLNQLGNQNEDKLIYEKLKFFRNYFFGEMYQIDDNFVLNVLNLNRKSVYFIEIFSLFGNKKSVFERFIFGILKNNQRKYEIILEVLESIPGDFFDIEGLVDQINNFIKNKNPLILVSFYHNVIESRKFLLNKLMTRQNFDKILKSKKHKPFIMTICSTDSGMGFIDEKNLSYLSNDELKAIGLSEFYFKN